MISHPWIKDIKENDKIQGLYLVKMKKQGVTRKGTPFLSLTLSDRTGELDAKVWERADVFSPLFKEGDILEVAGYAASYRNEIQLTVSNLRVPDQIEDRTVFLESTPKDVAEMMRSLKDVLNAIEDRNLKGLVNRFLSDRPFLSLFKQAPAAKNFHHAYLGGLLEHTLAVCRMAQSVVGLYANLDGDLLLVGAFLHDIGKIREFQFDRKIDYSGEGRLLGHLMLGVAMLDEKLSVMKGFPPELALKLKHLILSHHGEYEYGSPKRPKFPEAFALHLIDDLDAKMNGLSRIMERDRQEGGWTDFNRLFGRYLLKGSLEDSMPEAESVPVEEDKQKALFPV